MKGEFVTVLFLFLAIIAFSLWIANINGTITPYSRGTGYAAYEGFSSSMLTGSQVDTNLPVNDVNVKLITKPTEVKCANLGGAWDGDGVFCSPDDSNHILDIFSQAPGSLDCGSTASGYHNSKGGLCMTNDMMGLLTTRGGNAVAST